MKSKTKLITSIIATILGVVLLFSIVCTSAVKKEQPLTNAEAVRYIDANNINSLSYEKKAEQLLSQFDNYDSKIDNDGNMTFEGVVELDLSQTMMLNFVNSYEEKIEKRYKTTINPENFDFIVSICYYQDEELLSSEEIVTQPYYVEEADDYFIDLQGETISLKETLVSDSLNECIAIADDIIIAAAACMVITVIVFYPQITEIVTTVVKTVVSWVKSFWWWLKSLFVKKTVTTTTTTVVKSFRINIFSKTLTLKKVEDGKLTYDPNIYYVAVLVGQDVYISYQMITQAEAIALLAQNVFTIIEEGSTTEYQLNTYTYSYDDALVAATSAATLMGRGGYTWHNYHQYDRYGNKKKGTFFQHFHPGSPYVEHSTHSFYGTPVINT